MQPEAQHIHRTMNTLSMRSNLLRYCGRGQPVRFFTAGTGASSINSSNDLVITTVNETSGIAMLTMNRPPANSLSLEMNKALCASIKTMETNPKIQSVILSSSNPKIFSAGLDVSELINPNPDRLPQFWNSLQQLYLDMYGSRLAIVAAIQGHAPAAGCFLAMACDYRIMSAGDMGDGGNSDMKKKFVPTIGLNETQLGIAAPPWMGQLLVRTIGFRQAELALALGTLFPPDRAQSIGLVDEIVSQQQQHPQPTELSSVDGLLELLPPIAKDQVSDSLMQKAYHQAKTFAKIPPHARVASKLVTRQSHIHDMIATRDEDTAHFCGFVMQEAVQKNLIAYVEAMKSKSKKK